MVYADYEFYIGSYYGNVSTEDFRRLATRASSFLDYYTGGRAEKNADLYAVKMACCALVDKYYALETAQAAVQKAVSNSLSSENGELQSESVGGYSRTFRSSGDMSAAALKTADIAKSELAAVANEYLAQTGLLYRGGHF